MLLYTKCIAGSHPLQEIQDFLDLHLQYSTFICKDHLSCSPLPSSCALPLLLNREVLFDKGSSLVLRCCLFKCLLCSLLYCACEPRARRSQACRFAVNMISVSAGVTGIERYCLLFLLLSRFRAVLLNVCMPCISSCSTWVSAGAPCSS